MRTYKLISLTDFSEQVKQADCGDHQKGGSTKVLSRTPAKTRTSASIKFDSVKDKDLINSGLHKLISSFNTAQKIGHKPSKIATATSGSKKNEAKLPERQLNSHIILTKQVSIDKYTMTDFEDIDQKLCVQSTVLDEKPYRDLQWTDPRLLKKYSLIKEPFKKSLTIPNVSKSEYNSEVVENTCEEEAEFIYSEKQHFLFKCLYYFCTASVSFIGFMCGITLITVIFWKVLDENLLNFHFETPRDDLLLRRFIRGGGKTIIDLVSNIFGKIMRLLTISTSEVFAAENEHGSPQWYHKLY